MKKLAIIALILGTAVFLAGATDDPRGRFTANLTGGDVRPRVETQTEGRFSLSFNNDDTKARFYLRVEKGVGITHADLHCHNTRLNDPVAATLFGFIPGGFDIHGVLGTFMLDDDNIASQNSECGITTLSELRQAIEGGRIYVNVHSVANPSGEIQGQVSYYSKDTDRDGIRDTRDPDIDGDGIPNAEDPTPYRRRFGSPPPPSDRMVTFRANFNDQGGALTCDPPPATGQGNERTCQFGQGGQLTITRVGWQGGTAVLNEDGTITGDCDGSLIANSPPDDYNLIDVCLKAPPPTPDPPPARQDATGTILVKEWFTDLPWHQKLSTVHSNQIDVPFVLPFEALDFPNAECQSATDPKDRARCVLQYGIVSVMGMERTDRLYQPGEAAHSEGQNCQDGKCVEVKLKVQRFHTLTDHPDGYEADTITNNAFTYPDPLNTSQNVRIPSQGFAITEATIFAPWLPWYTGHYCARDREQPDSVCYDDYFTTQIQAPAPPGKFWLRNNPALFHPNPSTEEIENENQGAYAQFCQRGNNSCDLYLGKVDWLKGETEPKVVDCRFEVPDIEQELSTCQAEVINKTDRLVKNFNDSITGLSDQGRYPWKESFKSKTDLSGAIATNPFIGVYNLKGLSLDFGAGFPSFRGTHYVLPRQCTSMNFLGARQGNSEDIEALRDCTLNFEIHTSGFHEIWKTLYAHAGKPYDAEQLSKALRGFAANQYGRTMFMMAGVPEQKIAASYKKLDDGLSIYDKMYGSSLYTQYLPLVNPADLSLAVAKNYDDAYWHNILMSNHMNQTPDHFIRGIRGRTLWHNEYRSHVMYNEAVTLKGETLDGTPFADILPKQVDFPSGFQPENHQTPFHGNTCDSCHIRNGSGIPLMPDGKLPEIHRARGMTDNKYNIRHDYTYSNQHIPSMKMVLFDLKDPGEPLEQCDVNDHAVPRPLYQNKIMNFYGNSFHVNQEGGFPTYTMKYEAITDNSGYEIVDKTERKPIGNSTAYQPQKISISNINSTGNQCQDLVTEGDGPTGANGDNWPTSCTEVNGEAISQAINSEDPQVGFLHLLGRRLGNTPLIEMIPNQTIMNTQTAQAQPPDPDRVNPDPKKVGLTYPGCYGLAPGTRNGEAAHFYRSCESGELGTDPEDGSDTNACYISRFGWMGDRASLEDQIANAANVEMNITSIESYQQVHPEAKTKRQLVRYNKPLCGPADATCQSKTGNSDITEQEIKDMATYQRWIGIPNRSEYQVSSRKVQRGEKVFKDLKCHSCHVIDKIPFVKLDNMLPDEERISLEKVKGGQPDYPFVSYLGTDLLLHDMGYLSQVAKASNGQTIRNDNGTVESEEFKAYVQPIRTPALKGLRFNRFVTDSNHNTQTGEPDITGKNGFEPGCDFLLHDGRACDAIEAAYLHDGPAVKALGMIAALNQLTLEQLKDLRAFLYSL